MGSVEDVSFLIVDDVLTIREFLRQNLMAMAAQEIYESSSGEDALSKFAKYLPDVVFLDIELPGINGQELLKEFRKIKPNAYIVMVSGHASAENVKTSIGQGASGFIVKPFTAQKLRSEIRRYIQSR